MRIATQMHDQLNWPWYITPEILVNVYRDYAWMRMVLAQTINGEEPPMGDPAHENEARAFLRAMQHYNEKGRTGSWKGGGARAPPGRRA